jgi:LysM repeat protein
VPSTTQNAYRISGLVAVTAFLAPILGTGATFFLLTPSADAFWPFTVTKASTGGADSPIISSSSLGLLEAATNPDPNPSKGGNDLTLTEDSALIANVGPDGTVSDTAASGSTGANAGGSISRYTVKEGDNLSQIAADYGVSMNTILWANSIKDAKTIKPGTVLVILPTSGIQHTVIKGETLAGIAKKYSADADDIAAFNGLDNGAALAAGDSLIIPGGELPSAPTKTVSTTKAGSKASSGSKSGSSHASSLINPYRGGSGAEIGGFWSNPVPGALLTQGIHGWNGVDLGAPSGTPVYASAGGTVIVSKVGGWNGGYGTYVVIDHGNGTQSLYAHLSSDAVSVGESVSSGERIGAVGRTGEATGNHLHFEIRGAKNPFAGCALLKSCSI